MRKDVVKVRALMTWMATLAFGLPVAAAADAAGDAARGLRAFQRCAACHSVEPGQHFTGPSLASAWGRKAGTAAGFDRYSQALQRADVVWNAETLDRWLADPEAFIPGNEMSFPGIANGGLRSDVIAYLKAVADGTAPRAPQGGGHMGGMMGGRSGPADLKQSRPDTRVVSLRHCRQTYTIGTADGTSHKIWEYNLRLKTDSSPRGPEPGKPVATGSGMQGDRVSIVFSTPKELADFIQESCD
jgi:cytochrome c